MPLILSSHAFANGALIPRRHTCEGENISPDLHWSNAPENTQSFVLIVDDPDAPDPAAPKRTWVHWVLYNIPPNATGLDEAISASNLPEGAMTGLNDWGRPDYGGPCPPIGRHRYFHKLYALDTTLPDLGHATKATIEKAMQGHVIDHAELIGLYQKGR